MPTAHGRADLTTADSTLWSTLEQSELATALSARALGVSLGVNPELYALHHPSTLLAMHRLRRWGIRTSDDGPRSPWAIRQTPVVHGWVLAQLSSLRESRSGAADRCRNSLRSLDDCAGPRLIELLRLSTQRASLLHGLAVGADIIGSRLLEKALAAVGVIDAQAVRRVEPLRPARFISAAGVVLAVEITMATRTIRQQRCDLPGKLQSVLAHLERSLDQIERQTLSVI
jgi:hypothetical protein